MAVRKARKAATFKVAKKFIDEQFAIMKKYGAAPKLSADAYGRLLEDTEKSLTRLASLKLSS